MSSKTKPRLKVMRVKLTRDLLPSTPVEGSRLERVSTEPDCRKVALLQSRREADRLRNLSMSVEDRKDEAKSRESTMMKLVAAGRTHEILRCSLQNGDRGWMRSRGEEGRSATGRARLSLAVPKEDRRFEILFGGYQSPAPRVAETPDQLEEKLRAKKLEEDLISAQETIAGLNENVHHLTLSLQQQSDSNASLLHTLDSLSPSAQSSLQSSIQSLQNHLDSQLSLLSTRVTHTESRFNEIESQVKQTFVATLDQLSEANECLNARSAEESALRQEITRLQTLLRQVQDYASVHISALEQDNESLREANASLESDFNQLEVENESLHNQLLAAKSLECEAAQASPLRNQISVLTDDLQSAHSLIRLQRVEIVELKSEMDEILRKAKAQTTHEQELTEALQRLRLEIKEMQDAYMEFENELRSGNMRKTIEMLNRERRRMAQSVDIDNQMIAKIGLSEVGEFEEVTTVKAVKRCVSPLTPDISPRINLEEAITSPSEDALENESDKTPIAIDLRTAVLTLISELPSPQAKSVEKMITTVIGLLQAPESLLALVDRTRKFKPRP